MEVIVDTREQKPFLFKSYADVNVTINTVKTGDYTCLNYEFVVTVDRKATPAELSLNLGSKLDTFTRELERMRSIEFCYFVCAFPYSYLETFPVNSNIPKSKWKKLKITSKYLTKKVKEIEEEYKNVKFIFCRNEFEAEEVTYNILKEHTSGR